ncbi:eukaryotic translation initiation factor 6 [Trichinella spiralis]|uniref:eukaryotic translation initiation factor 6 n=1 Tax=Trichinella spiralis TaxID=6334 RepID=UPI0001EFCE1E|nr:eukaryotic translation initiation factor 6 [Trichinella spiralis]
MHAILERKFRKLLLYAWHLTLAFGGSSEINSFACMHFHAVKTVSLPIIIIIITDDVFICCGIQFDVGVVFETLFDFFLIFENPLGSVVIEYKRLSCGRMEHVRVDLVIADRSHTGTVPKIPRVLGVTTLPSGP